MTLRDPGYWILTATGRTRVGLSGLSIFPLGGRRFGVECACGCDEFGGDTEVDEKDADVKASDVEGGESAARRSAQSSRSDARWTWATLALPKGRAKSIEANTRGRSPSPFSSPTLSAPAIPERHLRSAATAASSRSNACRAHRSGIGGTASHNGRS